MTNSEIKEEKRVVFVPACMLCPSFQAVRSEKNLEWPKQVIPFFLENSIGIIPMPCPEVTFGGLKRGAERSPHGVDYYTKAEGFVDHCERLSRTTADQIEELLQAGFTIEAIVGIERSPTCAASFMYTNRGTEKRQGIFIRMLCEQLAGRRIEVPVVGVNRQSTKKFLKNISDLINQCK